MKFGKTAIAVAVTLVAALGAAPANAVTTTSSSASTASVKAALLQTEDTASSWTALSTTSTAELVTANAQSLHTSSGLALDTIRAQAWDINATQYVVQIPISQGQGVLAPSALTLIVDKSSRLAVATAETTFTPINASSGVVRAWSNGVKQVDKRIIAAVDEGASTRGATVSPQAAVGSNKWWNTLNACLAAMGVPAWVLTAVIAICTGACAITAGIGCILCIAAAAGFGTGVVTYCVGVANRA